MLTLFGSRCSQFFALVSQAGVEMSVLCESPCLEFFRFAAWVVLSALFGSLCFQFLKFYLPVWALNSLRVFPSWGRDVRPFRMSVLEVFIYMRLAARVIVMSALVGSLSSQLCFRWGSDVR